MTKNFSISGHPIALVLVGLGSLFFTPTLSQRPTQPSAISTRSMAPHTAQLQTKALTHYLAKKYSQPIRLIESIVKIAVKEAARVNLSPFLILAIIEQESSFNPSEANTYGAMGLMQIVGWVHKDRLPLNTSLETLLEPSLNIRIGVDILKEYLQTKNGNLEKALAKYSGNMTNYASNITLKKTVLQRITMNPTNNDKTLIPIEVVSPT
jgi:soluble lytic murein transglycosylase-like protein